MKRPAISAPRKRRALGHLGGPVTTHGEPDTAARLATIMGGEMDEDGARTHVHGFHSYPARMHPVVAQRAIELLSPLGGAVLDPFCGSGTVLVESRLAARRCVGVDLNPLAVLLSRVKACDAGREQLRTMLAVARRVVQHADGRRRERLGATRRCSQEDVELFDPHVLLELDGLRDGLATVHGEFVRDALALVFSSILGKVSLRPFDSSSQSVDRRIAAGFAIDLFRRKAEELAHRLEAFQRRLPQHAPPAEARWGDARWIDRDVEGSFHLVLSSPPYAGTYDYVDHHRLRLRWLDLSSEEMERYELGSRRQLSSLMWSEAVRCMEDDMTTVLRAARSMLLPKGRVVLLMADSVVGSEPVWAEPLIKRCGERAGLAWVATASQRRPHFHGRSRRAFDERCRQEHLVVLRRHQQGVPLP